MQLLSISGSLRKASSNTALLRAAAALAPDDVTVTPLTGIGELPHFNPDLTAQRVPAVRALRSAVALADGLLISCPEYAHGVPGSFKNALDWLVGGPEFMDKPVAFLNVSDRGTYALAAVRETVTVMTGRVVEEGSVTLPLLSGVIDVKRIVDDPELASLVARYVVRARRRADVSQRELAQLVGVSQSTICRVEGGEGQVDASTFVRS